MLRNILLFFVAAAGPWVIHLAPARQRLMALVGFIGVLLLWLALAENWLTKWWFWVGLLVGALSALFLGGGLGGNGHRRPPPPRTRRPRANDLTEEF
jgi:hypothetical protein